MKMNELFPAWDSSPQLQLEILADFLVNSVQLPKEAMELDGVTVEPYVIDTGSEVVQYLLEKSQGRWATLLGDCSLETLAHAKAAAYSVRHISTAYFTGTIIAYKIWHPKFNPILGPGKTSSITKGKSHGQLY